MTADLHLFSTLAPTLKQAMPIKARLPNISVTCVRSPDIQKGTCKSPSVSLDHTPNRPGSCEGGTREGHDSIHSETSAGSPSLPRLSPSAQASASHASSASTQNSGSVSSCTSSSNCSAAQTSKWIVGKQFPVIPNELLFMCVRNEEKVQEILNWQRDNAKNGDRVFFCADDELQYFPFCADFGPMHFGMTYRFITMLRTTIEQAKRQDKKVVVYTMADSVSRTNTAMLLILYLLLEKGYSAEEACLPFTFAGRNPFLPFRDASFQPVTFELHFIDIARGVQKALGHGMIDLATFDIELYEYCDHPSMADLHVIVPGKFVAMKGPHTRASFKDGVQFLPPSRYFDLFAKFGVTAVVRLNSEQYPAKAFRDAGFNHYDIIYDDCTNPDQAVIDAWWEVCRQEKGAIAVHCKAGLGRTGTLICLWLMRKYKFTGREAIGYNRLIRPGSILGPQQQYLVSKEQEMWALGDPDLPPKRETWSAVGTASGKKLLPRRMRMSSRSPERAQASAAEGRSKAKGGLLDEATAIASKILAQENTDAMNRRAAEMSAAAGGGKSASGLFLDRLQRTRTRRARRRRGAASRNMDWAR